jgi:hypothetical protein
VASQRVEDARSVRGLQVGEDEEAAGSGGDVFILAEKREVFVQDTAGGGVHHEALVLLEDLVTKIHRRGWKRRLDGLLLGSSVEKRQLVQMAQKSI